MTLPEGYDVKLERVEETGMANRRVWVYTLKFGNKQKHKKICVDVNGTLSNVSNPANFDGRSPSDHDDFEWDGVETKDIRVGSDPSRTVTKTFVCLRAKENGTVELDKEEEIELRFIGPADGTAGSVSLHSQSVFKVDNSNKRVLRETTWGDKGSTEIPLAIAVDGPADGGDPPGFAGLREASPDLAFLDLASVLDAETARRNDDEILAAPVRVLSGLPPDRWARVADALEAETVGDLLKHPAMTAVARLRVFL